MCRILLKKVNLDVGSVVRLEFVEFSVTSSLGDLVVLFLIVDLSRKLKQLVTPSGNRRELSGVRGVKTGLSFVNAILSAQLAVAAGAVFFNLSLGEVKSEHLSLIVDKSST